MKNKLLTILLFIAYLPCIGANEEITPSQEDIDLTKLLQVIPEENDIITAEEKSEADLSAEASSFVKTSEDTLAKAETVEVKIPAKDSDFETAAETEITVIPTKESVFAKATSDRPSDRKAMAATQKIPKKKRKRKKRQPKIKFNFEDEDLQKIIERFAAKKKINIILPQGAETIKQKVTFKQKKPIKLDQAEKYLSTILEISGYSMHPHNGFFVITKVTSTNFAREPLPLYVNVQPKNLPEKKRIRAIYYLANLRVPDAATRAPGPIAAILKDIIGTDAGYMFDKKSNGIILTGMSDKIASAMTIILELDSSGKRDVVEVFTIFNGSAETIAKLLNESILATTQKQGRKASRRKESGFYFAPNTIVVSDPRTNSLIVMGKESAVSRIREFVTEELDKPPDEGNSILHVYDLQYLKAQEFAQVLQNVVRKSRTGQSEKEFGGAKRFFEDIIIVAEQEKEAEKKVIGKEEYASKRARIGGNRLVIAAKSDDWKRIKNIIEQLDKPDLEAIIDIMIVDLTYDVNKLLQAQTRNPLGMFQNGIEFQSAHMHTQILDADKAENSTTLAADLLRLLSSGNSIAVPETSQKGLGSTIISLTDPCNNTIWSLFKVLDKCDEKKVIAHPFMVLKSGVQGIVYQKEIIRDSGRSEDSTSNITTILEEDFVAKIEVNVTPRIGSLDRLSLQITVNIQDFIGEPTEGNIRKTSRKIETNTNLSSGQILVIGGLTKTTNVASETELSLISKIPIIGNLFRGKAKAKEKSNLMVFIQPTIVDPKLRAGLDKYTSDKIELAYNKIHEGALFEDIKDPVTNFFFGKRTAVETEAALNEFLVDTNYAKIGHSEPAFKNGFKIEKDTENEKIKSLFAREKNPFNPSRRSASLRSSG